MAEEGYIIVLVTASSVEEGERIASVLLERKVAACVNITGGIRSLFWWEGKIDRAHEVLLIIKSKAALLEKVIGLVKENHSYDVPEVIALPVIGGSKAYLEWMEGVIPPAGDDEPT
ncbi:MAG TPA: divalent-cation tolerance protein CutA [Candidatus Latescibacteria bacterium]|nr:divalent-cation tolerance protein CutA [Candidatus Latescibacterota bacterium]